MKVAYRDMALFVVMFVAFVVLALTVSHAGSNCYQLGNQWVCSGQDASGGQWNTQTYQLGNNRITNGTTPSGQTFTRSCYWLGNNYVCN